MDPVVLIRRRTVLDLAEMVEALAVAHASGSRPAPALAASALGAAAQARLEAVQEPPLEAAV